VPLLTAFLLCVCVLMCCLTCMPPLPPRPALSASSSWCRYIGGGRKNWDGTGGSGAALQHYRDTGGLYPLCVKLGTITANSADVWSYADDEDCLVIDPLLPQVCTRICMCMCNLPLFRAIPACVVCRTWSAAPRISHHHASPVTCHAL